MLNCHKVYRFSGIKHASVVANAVLRVSMPANTQMISGFHKGKTSTRIVKDDARGDQNQNAYFFWPKLCHLVIRKSADLLQERLGRDQERLSQSSCLRSY